MGSLGVALSPVFGGALVALAGWRSIFLVNLPVCVLTVFLLRRHVTESPLNPQRRPDVPGLLLGVASLAGCTGGFITAGQQGWLSPAPGGLLAAGAAAAWFFVRAEQRRTSPMLPLALFRSRNLSGATGVGVIFNLVLYGSLLCRSLFLQQSRHESVLATGLLLVPMSLVVGTPLAIIVGGSVLIGLVALAMPAMTAVVVGAAGPEHAGVASGILNAARQSGGALGVAPLGSLLGGAGPSPGRTLSLHVPLAVAAVGYVIALGLAWTAIRAQYPAGNATSPAERHVWHGGRGRSGTS